MREPRRTLGGAGTLPFTSGFAFSVGAGLATTGLALACAFGAGLAFGFACALGAPAFFLFFAGFVLLAMPTSVLPSAREELVVVRSRVGLDSLWRPCA